jgi:MraZ protein
MTESNDFLGTTPIVIDDKGRFNVPSRIKSILDRKYNSSLIICVKENYLLISPQKEWDESKANWEKWDPFVSNKEMLKRMRTVLSSAKICEMKSGKVLIPADHREAVGLTKEAVLIGMSNTFEIWSKEQWANESGE